MSENENGTKEDRQMRSLNFEASAEVSDPVTHELKDTTMISNLGPDANYLCEQDSKMSNFLSYDKLHDNPNLSRQTRHFSLDSDLIMSNSNAGEPSRAYQAHGWNAYRAKNKQRERMTRKARIIENKENYSYSELLMFKVSVIPKIVWPALLHTLCTTLWAALYEVADLKVLSIPPTLISILGVAVTFVLVFRTNTAYDRYWEGRKAWGSLTSHIRNLSRFVWVCIRTETKTQLEQKHGCENLLIAYAVAIKHSLRNELGHHYEDLHYLLAHVKEFSPEYSTTQVRNLPVYIIVLVTRYFEYNWSLNLLGSSDYTDMCSLLSEMIECNSILERIKNTPIPFAYTVHISQTTNLYLLCMPFQLLSGLHWWTIAVVLMASFILLGLDSIALDIENPFKLDKNGLHLDRFCAEIKEDVYETVARSPSLTLDWGSPYSGYIRPEPTESNQ